MVVDPDRRQKKILASLATVARHVGLNAQSVPPGVEMTPVEVVALYRCALTVEKSSRTVQGPRIPFQERIPLREAQALALACPYAMRDARRDIDTMIRSGRMSGLRDRRTMEMRVISSRKIVFADACGTCFKTGRVTCDRCGGNTDRSRWKRVESPCTNLRCVNGKVLADVTYAPLGVPNSLTVTESVNCGTCRGTARIVRTVFSENFCSRCGGKGRTRCDNCRGSGWYSGHLLPVSQVTCDPTLEFDPPALGKILDEGPARKVAPAGTTLTENAGAFTLEYRSTYEVGQGSFLLGPLNGTVACHKGRIAFLPFLDDYLAGLLSDSGVWRASGSGITAMRRLPRTPVERAALLGIGRPEKRVDRLSRKLMGGVSPRAATSFVQGIQTARRHLISRARAVAAMSGGAAALIWFFV